MNVSDYTALITHEHRNAARFMDTVSFTAGAFVDLGNFLEAAALTDTLATATGRGLDVAGEWIGKERKALPYQPVPDELYRRILKAKIILNNWDSSLAEMYETWETVFPEDPIFIQEVAKLVLLIGCLGPATAPTTMDYSMKAGPLCVAPLDYSGINSLVVMTAVLDGTHWHTVVIYASGSEPIPAIVDLTNLTIYTGNLNVHICTEAAGAKVNYYNIITPEAWATIAAEYPALTLIATASDVFVQGTDKKYTFTMPSGWQEAEDIPPYIAWERPPALNASGSDSVWTPLSNSIARMIIAGHIIPKPSGVRILEYAFLPEEGKAFAWDIENSYFAGWEEGLWMIEVAPNTVGNAYPWILDTGYWNDDGQWDDINEWKDGP